MIQHNCIYCGAANEWPDSHGGEPPPCRVCGGSGAGFQESLPPPQVSAWCQVCGHEIPAGRARCVYCMTGLPGDEQTDYPDYPPDGLDVRRPQYRYTPEEPRKSKKSWIIAGIVILVLVGLYSRDKLNFKSEKTRVEEAVRDGLKEKLGGVPEQLSLNDQGGGRYKGTAIVKGTTFDVSASLTRNNLWFEYQERITKARMEEFVADSIKKQAGQAPTKVTLTDQGGGKYSGTAQLGTEPLLVSAAVEGQNLTCEWRPVNQNGPPVQVIIPPWQRQPGQIFGPPGGVFGPGNIGPPGWQRPGQGLPRFGPPGVWVPGQWP